MEQFYGVGRNGLWANNYSIFPCSVSFYKTGDNGLSSSIPTELGYLHHLQVLDLDGNKNIEGVIPTTIGQLHRLIFLDLDDNQISGTLPEGILSLHKLQTIDLDSNRLSGTLFEDIGEKLPNLERLHLHKNLLQGMIPTSIGMLTGLSKS